MKIRNPRVIGALGWLGARLIQGWIGTVRYQYRPVGPSLDPNRRPKGRFIYAFWHEAMLIPAFHYARPDIHVLISTHADGQLITEIIEHLGFRTVRGSSTRGGTEAMRHMLRLARESHIAITPDGPRGPRRRVQSGAVYLAARTGLPVVPIGIDFSRAWRAKSWDRFAVPLPFSKAYCVTTPPLIIPRHVTPETIEPYRLELERAMHAADRLAEAWAATGHFDPACYTAPQLLVAA
jgi:lysophospholipid acyltransferase (LPLAT)-like uncharacterized protein